MAEEKTLKIADTCINCGVCYSTDEKYFREDGEESRAVPNKNKVAAEDVEEVEEIADQCPSDAITVE